jgi:hypothetical protein
VFDDEYRVTEFMLMSGDINANDRDEFGNTCLHWVWAVVHIHCPNSNVCDCSVALNVMLPCRKPVLGEQEFSSSTSLTSKSIFLRVFVFHPTSVSSLHSCDTCSLHAHTYALTHSQAAYRNLPAMCEMLIRFGTDVNAQNRQGQTALHLVRLTGSH